MKQQRQPRPLASEPSHRTPESPYLLAKDAAVYLRFASADALYKAIVGGLENSAGARIPVLRRGRTLLFDRHELDRWLHAETVAKVTPFGNRKSFAGGR